MHKSMRNRLRNIERLINRPLHSDGQTVVMRIAEQMYEELDTPISLGAYLRLKYGEIEQLVGMKISPADYIETMSNRFADDYQAVSFLKKLPIEIPGVDREASAWKKFLQAEDQCRQTNARFRSMREGKYDISPAVSAVLHIAQRKIALWLGELKADVWLSRCRFGPGSDNLAKGIAVSAYDKFRSGLSCTHDFIPGAEALVQSHPSWVRALTGLLPGDHGPVQRPIIVPTPGNTVTFVPKTALIDRSIAIEPQLNIFAQLGLGALLRGRLKRVGLDLDDQEENQLLALRGSLQDDVVTIDLSSASDTLAREVVREFLPDPWFTALDWCRSKVGFYEDHVIQYEKFSSMGNGFTFELESMIFYAIALASAEVSGGDLDVVRSYGDDITACRKTYPLLAEALAFCGFTVNPDKSFSSGLFRESCGADFFCGRNVRPIFQKEILTDASSHYRLANSIRRWAYRRDLGIGCDGRFRRVWLSVVCRLPRSLRDLAVPPRVLPLRWPDIESDDGGLMMNIDEASQSPFVRRCAYGWEGWLYVSLTAHPRKVDTARGGAMTWLTALYLGRDGSETPTYGRVSRRGGELRRVSPGGMTPSWADLGSWTT